jgi:hypothetical protein
VLVLVATDAATGAPIRDYTVQRVGPDGITGRRARDAAGRYRADEVVPGRYSVSVIASGYATATHGVDVTLADDPAPVEFALVHADSKLTGRRSTRTDSRSRG